MHRFNWSQTVYEKMFILPQTRYGLRPSDKLSIDMIAGREAYNFP